MKLKSFIYRGLVLSFTLCTLAACWGALQLAPFDGTGQHWDLSSTHQYVRIGVQRGTVTISVIRPIGANILGTMTWHQKLLGSSIFVDNKQPMRPAGIPVDQTSPLITGPFSFTATIQLWQVAILLGCVPLLACYAAWRRHIFRRHNPNACRQCSYDLTDNRSGTCPECGTPVVTDTAGPTTA